MDSILYQVQVAVYGVFIGIIGTLLICTFAGAFSSSDNHIKDRYNVWDEFLSIYYTATDIAMDNLACRKEGELDVSDDEVKKYIEEKREKYICYMLEMKALENKNE